MIPHELDRVVCPDSQEQFAIGYVWDSPTAGPGFTPQRLAILPKHDHQGQECPFSGLPAPVVRVAAVPADVGWI